jgi:subtilisin family serine protease
MSRSPQRILLVLLLAPLLICAAPPRQLRAQPAPADYAPAELVVKIRGLGRGTLNKLAKEYQLDRRPLDQFGERQIYRMRILDGTAPPAKATQLLGDARVEFAEPNYLSSIPEDTGRKGWATGDTSLAPGSSWALAQIGLAAAPGGGAGQVVAVLDTGVDSRHPALRGRLVAGYDFVDNDRFAEEWGSPRSAAYGHGTHVAGIVAAVAPQAMIMPLRVLDDAGQGNLWVLAEALRFAADPNGDGDLADGASIINMSLVAARPTRLLADLLGSAADCPDYDRNAATLEQCSAQPGLFDQGVLVVAAAGNHDDGDPATPLPEVYPAAEPGVIGVTATDADDHKAWFANHSAHYVDIAAPGVGIAGLAPRNRYITWSGTSMAAPFVAGAAAVLWAADPDLSSAELTERLLASVTPIDQLNPAYQGELGAGRLDFRPGS